MRIISALFIVVVASTAAFAQGAAGVPAAPAPRADAYVLGVGDTIKVTVFDEPALSNSYRIEADGAFSYPYLERVKAAGRTAADVRDEIQKRLSEGFVRRPQVSVEVEQFRPRSITVLGQVKTPAKYPLVGRMTVLEAIAAAGGPTALAGTDIVVVQASQAKTVKLADVMLTIPEANLVLNDGDIVTINEARKFFVGGQVKSPGMFTWEPGMTVRKAITLAGGITEKGSRRRINIIRTVNGKEQRVDVDESDMVQPDDQIEVRNRLI